MRSAWQPNGIALAAHPSVSRMQTSRWLNRLRRYKAWLVLPALYVMISWSNWFLRRPEFYPFAPWAMFNNVPEHVTRFVVYVDQPDRKPMPIWSALPRGVNDMPLLPYRAQTKLGRSIENKDLQTGRTSLEHIRRFLSDTYPPGKAILIRETFNPAEKFRNGKYQEQTELFRFGFPASEQ